MDRAARESSRSQGGLAALRSKPSSKRGLKQIKLMCSETHIGADRRSWQISAGPFQQCIKRRALAATEIEKMNATFDHRIGKLALAIAIAASFHLPPASAEVTLKPPPLAGPFSWQAVAAFVSTANFTNLSLPLITTHGEAFFRIRSE
jgi:hypothetical protein